MFGFDFDINSIAKSYIIPKIEEYCAKYFLNFGDETFKPALGVLSSDLLLSNLLFRPDALDDFELPFKINYGIIGHCKASFTHAKLIGYGTPDLEIKIRDLYVVLCPPEGVRCPDEESLRKEKQRLIKEAENKLIEQPPAAAKDTSYFGGFGIKLDVLGVINNVKIVCENVHFRYEDESISFGISIKGFSAVSANEKFKEDAVDSTSKSFFKIVTIDDLGFYLNSKSTSKLTTITQLRDAILSSDGGLEYVLGPLNFQINAMVTLKPDELEIPFSKPRVQADLILENLDINLDNEQFESLLLFGDRIEAMKRREPYLKIRPFNTPVIGNGREWFKYAYECVKLNIRKKKSLSSLKDYWEKYKICKAYEEVYLKIIRKEPSDPLQDNEKTALDLEDKLSINDIIKIRKTGQVYMKKLEDAYEVKKAGMSYWSLMSYGADLTQEEIEKVLKKELTEEEEEGILIKVEKLREDEKIITEYPVNYQDNIFTFTLEKFTINFNEVSNGSKLRIFHYEANQHYFGMSTFPKSNTLKLNISMKNILITGTSKPNKLSPKMVRAIKSSEDEDLISIQYEYNPPNSKATHFLRIATKPIEIVYDSHTIMKIVSFFKWPVNVVLEETQLAAKTMLSNVKNFSKEGLQSIVQNQDSIDLDILITAPYILIPEGGDYYSDKPTNILAINLGSLIIHSSPRDTEIPTSETISNEVGQGLFGSGSTDISPAVLKLTYNQYDIKLKNLEVFIALAGEDILSSLNHTYSDDGTYHFDRPLKIVKTGELTIDLNQCIITNDPRFPSITGNLKIPLFGFDISDHRLVQLLKLLVTMPIPIKSNDHHIIDRHNFLITNNNTTPSIEDFRVDDKKLFELDSKAQELYNKMNPNAKTTITIEDLETAVQYTNLVWDLTLDNVSVNLICILCGQSGSEKAERIFDFNIKKFKSKYINRSFGTSVDVSIGTITSEYIGAKIDGFEGPVYFIYSHEAEDGEEVNLMQVHLFSINENCPKQENRAIKQKCDFTMASVDLCFHQESLGVLLGIVDSLIDEYNHSSAKMTSVKIDEKSKKAKVDEKKKERLSPKPEIEDILSNLQITLSTITLKITSESKRIASAKLHEFIGIVEDRPSQIKLFAQIKGLSVVNLDRATRFPNVLSLNSEDDVLVFELIQYKEKAKLNNTHPETSINLLILSPTIILQAYFIKNITNFLLELDKQRRNVWKITDEEIIQIEPELYTNDPKIQINVNLTSFKFILPRNDDSNEAVLLAFGNLSIFNGFSDEITLTNKKENPILDTMQIELDGIKICRALVDTKIQDVQAEGHILYPVKLGFSIIRNLSFKWYSQEPQVRIVGILNPLVIRTSPQDVGLISTCALDFVNRLTNSETVKTSNRNYALGGTSNDPIFATENEQETELIPEKIVLSMIMERLELGLYNNSPKIEGKLGIVEREESESSLAKGISEYLMFVYSSSIQSDIKVGVSVTNGFIQDTRGGTIKNFIVRREANESQSKGLDLMLAIDNLNGDYKKYKVTGTITGYDVVIDVGFLKQLKLFGDKIKEQIPEGDLQNATPALQNAKNYTLTTVDQYFNSTSIRVEEIHVKRDILPIIEANILLRESGIVILEDIESNDTNAVVVALSGSFTMVPNGYDSTGSGTWSVDIITAKVGREWDKRDKVADIVKPLTLNIKTDISQTDGFNYDIVFSEIKCQLSAGTVLLLTKIQNKLLAESLRAAEAEIDENKEIDYSWVWRPVRNDRANYWFLNIERSGNEMNTYSLFPQLGKTNRTAKPQNLNLSIPKLTLTLESGVGTLTTPLIMAELSLELLIKNWSSDLTFSGTFTQSFLYNNTLVGAWEYLTEPVEIDDPDNLGQPETKSWEIQFKGERTSIDGSNDSENSQLSISVISKYPLEITISKSGLNVIRSLVENFKISRMEKLTNEIDVNNPPYILRNSLGFDVCVSVEGSELFFASSTQQEFLIKSGEQIDLGLKLHGQEESEIYQKRFINISIPHLSFSKHLIIKNVGTLYYQLVDGQTRKLYGLVIEVQTRDTLSTVISLKSSFEIQNYLSLPVEIFNVYMSRTTGSMGTLGPGQKLDVPLQVVISGHDGILLKVGGYKPYPYTINWDPRQSHQPMIYPLTNEEFGRNGYIKIEQTQLNAMSESGSIQSGTYTMKIKPTLVVNNFMPYDLGISSDGQLEYQVGPGSPFQFLEFNPSDRYFKIYLRIPCYYGSEWTHNYSYVQSISSEKINFLQFSSTYGTMQLGCTRETQNGIITINVFFPYWMVNQTGMNVGYIGYGESRLIEHPPSIPGPLPYAYEQPHTNQAYFSIKGSTLSDSTLLNLDAAMSAVLVCHGQDRDFQVVVSNELSKSGLTKIITFRSRYTIYNSCPFDVVVKKVNFPQSLILVQKFTNVEFWPKARESDKIEIKLIVHGMTEESTSFYFEGTNMHLLKVDNKYSGLCANIYVRESKSTLTLSEFTSTETPLLFVNESTDLDISFAQEGVNIFRHVRPGESLAYTWDNLTECEGVVVWRIGEYFYHKKMVYGTPTSGEFKNNGKTYYFIFFPNGIRNVFLVSERFELMVGVADYLNVKFNTYERPTLPGQNDELNNNEVKLQLNVCLEGFGISLIDDIKNIDILYIKIKSTDVQWEKANLGREYYKLTSYEENWYLEHGYQNYINQVYPSAYVQLSNGISINYSTFRSNTVQYRRTAYQPGFGIIAKQFNNGLEVKLTVSRLEVDNNMEKVKYPKTIYGAPITQSVTNLTEIVPPLLLLKLTLTSEPKSTIKTITGMAVLQELNVAVELSLIDSIQSLVAADATSILENRMVEQYGDDIKKSSVEKKEYYKSLVLETCAESATTIYENLQVHMVKMKVNFSLSKLSEAGPAKNMFLGLGAALIDFEDKLVVIEGLHIQNQRMTNNQLLDTIMSHYINGAISNFYTAVLDLKCLGNPLSFVSGLGTGLTKLFVEPIHGALTGNLVEGISIGVGSALNSTVFGVTDSLSKVVGSLGTAVHAVPGLGIIGGNLLDVASGALKFLGSGTKGRETEIPPPMRIPRFVGNNYKLEPYNSYRIIGAKIFERLNCTTRDIGSYVLHMPTGHSGHILVLTTNKAICVDVSNGLNGILIVWTLDWKSIINIYKTTEYGRFLLKYDLPNTRALFGRERDDLQAVEVHSGVVLEKLYNLSVELWQQRRYSGM